MKVPLRVAAALAAVACSPALAHAQTAPSAPAVEAIGTTPTAQGGANRAVVVFDGQTPLIVGTAELAGLEIYDATGKRTGSAPAGEAVGVDARYGALGAGPLVAASDATTGSLRFYRANAGALTEVGARPVPLAGVAAQHDHPDVAGPHRAHARPRGRSGAAAGHHGQAACAAA